MAGNSPNIAYIWTGLEQNNLWTSPTNWKLNDNTVPENYPGQNTTNDIVLLTDNVNTDVILTPIDVNELTLTISQLVTNKCNFVIDEGVSLTISSELQSPVIGNDSILTVNGTLIANALYIGTDEIDDGNGNITQATIGTLQGIGTITTSKGNVVINSRGILYQLNSFTQNTLNISNNSLDIYGTMNVNIFDYGNNSDPGLYDHVSTDTYTLGVESKLNIDDSKSETTAIKNKSYQIIAGSNPDSDIFNTYASDSWNIELDELGLSIVNLQCLTETTDILTPNGYVNITLLNANDEVVTDDGRHVKIKKITSSNIISSKYNCPYIVPANSISQNYPPQEIRLSRSHLIKFNDKWVCPKTIKKFKRDTSKNIIKYFHVELENYVTDNLVINGGAIVESLGNKSHTLENKKRFKNLYIF